MKKLGMILVILMSKRNFFYKKALFLSVFFFIILSNNSLSQSSSHTIEYEVNENNPLRYEKDQAELYAKNDYRSRELGDNISSVNRIEQSSLGSSATVNTQSVGRGVFVKTNNTKFEYLSEGSRLFLKVTIYGKIKESIELANIDTKLMNRYPGGQEHLFNKFYTIKEGSDLVPYIRSNKKLFVSIFYLDNYREKVDLHVPYNSTENKLNEEIKSGRDYYFNYESNQTIEVGVSDLNSVVAYDKIIYVFSIEPFSFERGTGEYPQFDKKDFEKMQDKWFSSDKFQIMEFDILVER